MAEVTVKPGEFILKSPVTGDMRAVSADEADKIANEEGLEFAAPAEIDDYNARQRYGGFGTQAKAAGNIALRTATLGLAGDTSPEALAAERVLEQSNLGRAASFGAQAAGTVAPALVGGGVLGGAARALGAGARTAGFAAAVGEGGAAGYADELEQARREGRDVSIGNVLLFGVGGELLGRALPAALARGGRRLERAMTPAASSSVDALVDGTENVLVKADAKRLGRAVDDATGIPHGPDRDEFIARSADAHYSQLATRARKSFDELTDDFRDLGDVSKKPDRIAPLVPDTAPVQYEWANVEAGRAQEAADRLLKPERVPRETLEGPIAGDELGGAMAALEGPAYAWSKGVQRYADRAGKTMRNMADGLQDVDTSVDWFIAADQGKRSLQKQVVDLDRQIRKQTDLAVKQELEDLRTQLMDFEGNLRGGLENEGLWGRAAQYQQDVNRAWTRYLQGVETVESDLTRVTRRQTSYTDSRAKRTYDPAKVESILRKDRDVGRKVLEEQLDHVLAGAEDMAAAHRKWDTADPKQIQRLEENAKSIRAALGEADEIQGAELRWKQAQEAERNLQGHQRLQDRAAAAEERAAAKADREAARQAREAEQAAKSGMGDALNVAGLVGGALPGVGGLVRLGRLLGGLGNGGRVMVARAARMAARGAEAAPRALVPVMTTALERFTGDHPDWETSYAAKRNALLAAQKDPTALFEAIGTNVGELDRVNPRLSAELATRMVQATAYLTENLPAGVSVSMMYPDGMPPSESAVRDFAVRWNSVMDPATVVDDLAAGVCEPQQWEALLEVHPDIALDVQTAMTVELAQAYEDVPIQTKIWLDLIFGGDGLAGALYSSRAAQYIEEARQVEQEQAQGAEGAQSRPSGPPVQQEPQALAAIRGGVTNSVPGSRPGMPG